MTLTLTSAAGRRLERIRLALLVAVSIAVAHQVVFAAWFGVGRGLADALAVNGHPVTVPLLVVLAVGAALAFAAIVAWRFNRLRELTAAVPAHAVAWRTAFGGRWWSTTSRVTVWTSIVYVLLENVEHALGHGHVEGLSVLGPDPLVTIGLVLVVSSAVTAVGLMVRWREVILEEQLRAVDHRRAWARAGADLTAAWSPSAAIAIFLWIIARRTSGRAPPPLAEG